MPGFAPRPTNLKLLMGETKKNRLNPDEPIPLEAEPELPEDTSDAVREIWDFIVPELRAMRTLARCDRDALIAYCNAVVNHRNASRLIARSGVLIPGEGGRPIRNPALSIQRDNADLLRKLAQEFGLTPSARSRIRVEEASAGVGDNPFNGKTNAV